MVKWFLPREARLLNEGKDSFQQMPGKLRWNLDPYLRPQQKKKTLKTDQRPKIIKLVADDTGGSFPDTRWGDDFLAVTPKTQTTNGRTDELGFNQC